jgi:hypothetical protein
LGCLTGDPEPAGDLCPRVSSSAQPSDSFTGGVLNFASERDEIAKTFDVPGGDAAAVSGHDAACEGAGVIVLYAGSATALGATPRHSMRSARPEPFAGVHAVSIAPLNSASSTTSRPRWSSTPLTWNTPAWAGTAPVTLCSPTPPPWPASDAASPARHAQIEADLDYADIA